MFFLSADSISKFLSSADFFFFVSKCLCRRHINDAHAGIVRFAPACFLTEKFSPSAGAHFRFYHDSIRFAGPSWGSTEKGSRFRYCCAKFGISSLSGNKKLSNEHSFNGIQPYMYFIARKTNIMTFWLNARIFSTHPYFSATNIGRREYILKQYFFLKVHKVQFKIRLRSALSSDGVCISEGRRCTLGVHLKLEYLYSIRTCITLS